MITTSDRILTDYDLHLLAEGTDLGAYEKLGAHLVDGGAHFAVWAPNAASVSVIGDFNEWTPGAAPMQQRPEAGMWELFVPDLQNGSRYKYHVVSRLAGHTAAKADPYAFYSELRPGTASRVWDLNSHNWHDAAWVKARPTTLLSCPVSIYEVHAGSWMRVPEEGNRWLTWRELAIKLGDYVCQMGKPTWSSFPWWNTRSTAHAATRSPHISPPRAASSPQRTFLARQISHRAPSRGRCRIDAVSRLRQTAG